MICIVSRCVPLYVFVCAFVMLVACLVHTFCVYVSMFVRMNECVWTHPRIRFQCNPGCSQRDIHSGRSHQCWCRHHFYTGYPDTRSYLYKTKRRGVLNWTHEGDKFSELEVNFQIRSTDDLVGWVVDLWNKYYSKNVTAFVRILKGKCLFFFFQTKRNWYLRYYTLSNTLKVQLVILKCF